MDPFSKSITNLLFGATVLLIGRQYWLTGISVEVFIALCVWLAGGLSTLTLLALISWLVVRVEVQEQRDLENASKADLSIPTLSIWHPASDSDVPHGSQSSPQQNPEKWKKAA